MRSLFLTLVGLSAVVTGCAGDVTAPKPADVAPYTTFEGDLSRTCPAMHQKTILIDPTHDGGTWWFPQSPRTGFKSGEPHQGRALADYLRARGFTVVELARGEHITPDSMMTFALIVRAGYYFDVNHPGYTAADLAAYDAYLSCPRTLIMLADFLRDSVHDALADQLGIHLQGNLTGDIDTFVAHAITTGVTKIPFIAGSYLTNDTDPLITVLGRSGSKAVMGLLTGRAAKVFFVGDVNGIETVPQPFVSNLVDWASPP